MSTPTNVVQLNEYRAASRQEVIDDISTGAFMLVRDSARQHGMPIKKVLTEHMLDIALVIHSVDGPETLAEILDNITRQIQPD